MAERYTLEFEKPVREMEDKIAELERLSREGEMNLEKEIARLRKRVGKLKKEVYDRLTRWQQVQLARHPQRPYALDYLGIIAPDFTELHGDRSFRDDPSIVAGLGTWSGHRAVIIAQQKGRGTKENLRRNFGMAHPEGYRKALRMMKLAEKFDIPVITLIDTPGAYPGIGAEERGQASAIAENLLAMAQLKVPIVAAIIGEGGSGGALALAVADRIYMLAYAIYSVISPEGCASILYRDASHANQAAEALKLTAADSLENKLIDGIIPEPQGGAHKDPNLTAQNLAAVISAALDETLSLDPEERISLRIAKYEAMGEWRE